MLQSRSASHFNMASRAPDVTVDELPPPLPPLMGTYPISNATYGSHNMLMDEPYLPPPPIQAPPPKPAVTSRVPRFTEYLQNESLQLRQRGHVYRVSKQGRDAAVTSQAPAAATNTVRKTVRFSSDAKAASPDTSYEQLDVSSLPTVHAASVPHITTPYTDFASVRSHAGMPLSSLPDTGSLRRPSQDVATVTLRGASANELDSLV